MNRSPYPFHARLPRIVALACASLLAYTFAGCTTAPAVDEEDTEVALASEALGARRRTSLDVTAGMRWLAARSEDELARIFANGTAEAIPLGANNGMPLLPRRLSSLEPVAVVLYQGSVWSAETGADGQPVIGPDGDPIVTLRDKFLRDGEGGLVTYFEGRILRRKIANVDVGAPPPKGSIRPYFLSPFTQAIVVDDKPSLFIDYHADPTPFVNRILDEIREVDRARCPGLYLGRAYYLRDRGRGSWSYLYYFAFDFGPQDRVCELGE